MFFLWERRVQREYGGEIKARCPICGKRRKHAKWTHSARDYVYLIPVAVGQPFLVELECTKCGPAFARTAELQDDIDRRLKEGDQIGAALRACEWPLVCRRGLDLATAATAASILGVPVALFLFAFWLPPSVHLVMAYAAAAAFPVFAALTLWVGLGVRRRFARRLQAPKLAALIATERIDASAVTTALEGMRGSQVGRALRASDLAIG